MPGSRGFLDRFRASGTPGAPAGAGVPADRVAERDAELAAVLSHVDPYEDDARRIRAEAQARAEKRIEDALAQRQRILLASRHDAEAQRRDAAAQVAALSEAQTRKALEDAQVEAEAVTTWAETMIAPLVDQVLATVADRLGVSPEVLGAGRT